MYILGDIGNTETKIFLISINNKIIKKYIGPLNKVSVEEIKSFIK